MKKFDNKLDFLSVISMALVVVVHITNYYLRNYQYLYDSEYMFSLIFNVIARMSVPIFFMISGAKLLGKEYDDKKNNRRIRDKLIVLLVITIIYCFWDKYYNDSEIEYIYLLFNPERNLLWFMYAIIGIYIALPYIKLMVDHMTPELEKRFVILWISINGLFRLSEVIRTYKIPIIEGTYFLGYFIIGYLILKYKDQIKEKISNKLLLLLLILSISIVVIYTYNKYMELGYHFNKLLQYGNIFTMISSMSLFMLIYFNMSDKKYKTISFISGLSFGVYLFHGIILDLCVGNLHCIKMGAFIGLPLLLFIILIVTFIIVFILKKIKFIGKYI